MNEAKETVSSRVITETERACRGSAQVQTDRVPAPRWAVDKRSHPQPRSYLQLTSTRKGKTPFSTGVSLVTSPKLSNSQHKRNSMVFTGDFLFPFSTYIVLSGFCFLFLKKLVFSLYITASGFVFLWVCVYLRIYIFLVLFLLLFVHFHSALLLFICFVLFSICLSVFLKDRMHGDEGAGRWGESGKRWGRGNCQYIIWK